MIKVLKFYRKYTAWMKVLHNLVSIFQGEKFTWKYRKKTLNIYNIRLILSSFHQNDHNVSGHVILVTDGLENVGEGHNL